MHYTGMRGSRTSHASKDTRIGKSSLGQQVGKEHYKEREQKVKDT